MANSSDIASLVPDPDDLLRLTVEEQGGLIAKLVTAHDTPQNPISHSNFFNRANDFAQRPEYASRQQDADIALMGAWSWLEMNGYLAKAPTSAGNWFFLTVKGKQFASQNSAGAFVDARLLPRDRLHPSMKDKVYAAFLRGHYDAAIFQAFLEIEVAVRTAAGLHRNSWGTS